MQNSKQLNNNLNVGDISALEWIDSSSTDEDELHNISYGNNVYRSMDTWTRESGDGDSGEEIYCHNLDRIDEEDDFEISEKSNLKTIIHNSTYSIKDDDNLDDETKTIVSDEISSLEHDEENLFINRIDVLKQSLSKLLDKISLINQCECNIQQKTEYEELIKNIVPNILTYLNENRIEDLELTIKNLSTSSDHSLSPPEEIAPIAVSEFDGLDDDEEPIILEAPSEFNDKNENTAIDVVDSSCCKAAPKDNQIQSENNFMKHEMNNTCCLQQEIGSVDKKNDSGCNTSQLDGEVDNATEKNYIQNTCGEVLVDNKQQQHKQSGDLNKIVDVVHSSTQQNVTNNNNHCFEDDVMYACDKCGYQHKQYQMRKRLENIQNIFKKSPSNYLNEIKDALELLIGITKQPSMCSLTVEEKLVQPQFDTTITSDTLLQSADDKENITTLNKCEELISSSERPGESILSDDTSVWMKNENERIPVEKQKQILPPSSTVCSSSSIVVNNNSTTTTSVTVGSTTAVASTPNTDDVHNEVMQTTSIGNNNTSPLVNTAPSAQALDASSQQHTQRRPTTKTIATDVKAPQTIDNNDVDKNNHTIIHHTTTITGNGSGGNSSTADVQLLSDKFNLLSEKFNDQVFCNKIHSDQQLCDNVNSNDLSSSSSSIQKSDNDNEKYVWNFVNGRLIFEKLNKNIVNEKKSDDNAEGHNNNSSRLINSHSIITTTSSESDLCRTSTTTDAQVKHNDNTDNVTDNTLSLFDAIEKYADHIENEIVKCSLETNQLNQLYNNNNNVDNTDNDNADNLLLNSRNLNKGIFDGHARLKRLEQKLLQSTSTTTNYHTDNDNDHSTLSALIKQQNDNDIVCEFDVNEIAKFTDNFNEFYVVYDEFNDNEDHDDNHTEGIIEEDDEDNIVEEQEVEEEVEVVVDTRTVSTMRGDATMGNNGDVIGGDQQRNTNNSTVSVVKRHNPDHDNLKSLLKKPKSKTSSTNSSGNHCDNKKSNRVVFNEKRNEFFEADYIILIREECDYDEDDDDGICTCNQHEMVRLTCCEPNCNCNYETSSSDYSSQGSAGHGDGGCVITSEQTPPSPKYAPPLEFVDAVTLSPPEGYKDMDLGEQQLIALQQLAARQRAVAAAAQISQGGAVCRDCSSAAVMAAAAAAAAQQQQFRQQQQKNLMQQQQQQQMSDDSDGGAHSEDETMQCISSTNNVNFDQSDMTREISKTDQSQQTTPTTPTSTSPLTEDIISQGAPQRYILETITMTTVTEQRIMREAADGAGSGSQSSGSGDDANTKSDGDNNENDHKLTTTNTIDNDHQHRQQHHEASCNTTSIAADHHQLSSASSTNTTTTQVRSTPPNVPPSGGGGSGSPISGILKGGRLWNKQQQQQQATQQQTSATENVKTSSSIENRERPQVTVIETTFSADSDEVTNKRSVRFCDSDDEKRNSDEDDDDDYHEREEHMHLDPGGDENLDNQKTNETDNCNNSISPDGTEMMLTFKLGNHLFISNNSLRPNSAVRQLFPCANPLTPNDKIDSESGQQYLITSESLRAFEETKRTKLPQLLTSCETNDDSTIRKTIERNTLRRSLIRYEPRTKKTPKTDNSLVERIKQLTCDVDDNPMLDSEQQQNNEADDSMATVIRTSPPGEEARKSPEINTINNKNNLDKNSFSPSSSSTTSSNSSMSSTYKKITDLFAKKHEKATHVQAETQTQSSDLNTRPNNMHSAAPDLGNGKIPNSDFIESQCAVSKYNVTHEARKQFLSTLAPLAACVGGGTTHEEYYYQLSTQAGERISMASTVGTEYSLEDIDAVLQTENNDELKRVAPDVLVGTPSASESGDELAMFVQQDASRIERIKKRYQPENNTNEEDDEQDDYGFNRRPSVRGIKPRFSSTNEILQQIQNQLQPPTSQTQQIKPEMQPPPPKLVPTQIRAPGAPVSWPYYSETNINNPDNKNVPPQIASNRNIKKDDPEYQAQQNIPSETKYTYAQTYHYIQDTRGYRGPLFRPNSLVDESMYENCTSQRCNQQHYTIAHHHTAAPIMRIGGGCAELYQTLPTPRRTTGRPESPPPMEVARNYHQTMVLIPYNRIEGYQPNILSPNPQYGTTDNPNFTRTLPNKIKSPQPPHIIRQSQESQINYQCNTSTLIKGGQKQMMRIPYTSGQPVQVHLMTARSDSPQQFATARSTQTSVVPPTIIPAATQYYSAQNQQRYRPAIGTVNSNIWAQQDQYVTKPPRPSGIYSVRPMSDGMLDSQMNGYRTTESLYSLPRDSAPTSPTKSKLASERGVPEGAASISPQDSFQSNSSTGNVISPTGNQQQQQSNVKPMYYAMNV